MQSTKSTLKFTIKVTVAVSLVLVIVLGLFTVNIFTSMRNQTQEKFLSNATFTTSNININTTEQNQEIIGLDNGIHSISELLNQGQNNLNNTLSECTKLKAQFYGPEKLVLKFKV